jgi:PAS domain S-box-containing protein
MEPPRESRAEALHARFRGAQRCLSAALVGLGVLVIGGKGLSLTSLRPAYPQVPSVGLTTAICFVLLGGAFLLRGAGFRHASWVRRLAALVVLVAGLTLLEHLTGVNLRPGALPFAPAGPGDASDRMALPTALGVLALGIGLLVDLGTAERDSRQSIAQLAAAFALAIGLSGLLGRIYISGTFVSLLRGFTSIPVPTTIGLLIAGLSLLFLRPRGLIIEVLSQASLAGAEARRLAFVVLPLVVLGLVGLRYLEGAGRLGSGEAAALWSLWIIAPLLAFAWRALGALGREEAARERALAELSATRDSLEGTVLTRTVALAAMTANANAAHTRLEAIVNSATDLIAAIDTDYRFVVVNRAYQEAVQLEQGVRVLPGMLYDDAFPKSLDYRERKRALWARALAGERFTTVEQIPGRAGRTRTYERSFSPVADSGGRVTGAVGVLRDITDRLELERRAEETRRLLEGVLHHASAGIFVKDAEGRYLLANPVFGRMTGRAPEEIPGLTDLELFPPEMARAAIVADSWTLAEQLPDLREVELEIEPLGRRTFLISKMPIPNGQDGWYICGIATDITERKATERALEKSEARLQLTLSTAEVGLWDWSMLSGEVAYDRNFNAILGYGSAEALPDRIDTWTSTMHPDDLEAVLEVLERHLADPGVLYDVVYRARHREGRWIWVNSRGRVVERDQAGNPVRMMGTIVDVTRRKEAEAQLERIAGQLQHVLTTAPDGIIVIDRRGIITGYNRAAERLFGWLAEEILGQSFTLLMPPEARERYLAELEQHAASGLSLILGRSVELTGLRRDGSTFPLELSVSELRHGDSLQYTGIIREITERKRHEALLAQRNQDLETLLHVVSHDLKEPLRGVESFSRIVAERYRDRLDDKGVDFLDRVVRAAGRMHQLLVDITTLARARRAALPTTPVDGTEIAESVLTRLEGSIREADARVAVAAELPLIWADRTWATEALYNLVTNGLKFRSSGSPAELEIGPWTERGQSGFVVLDRGPGVLPELRTRIFELFQRGVGREVEGTGAGLAITRQIAERFGGRAWMEPREGGGSAFYLSFSAAGPEDEA